MSALAMDDATAVSTTFEALLAAKAAGHSRVIVDGTVMHTDRISTPGPTTGWTCGGAKNITITAGTSRPSPLRMNGLCGPLTSGLAGSMT